MASQPNQLDEQRGVRDLSPSRCLSLPFEETAEKMFIVLRSWSASDTPCPTTSTCVGADSTVLMAKWGTLRETGADCFGVSLWMPTWQAFPLNLKKTRWMHSHKNQTLRSWQSDENLPIENEKKFSKYVCPLHEVTLTRHKLRRTKSSSYWVPQCHELRIQMWFIVCALPCSARPTSLGERVWFSRDEEIEIPNVAN